jgi:outer membrane protein OmpA-like peptidoglycan-associated protein
LNISHGQIVTRSNDDYWERSAIMLKKTLIAAMAIALSCGVAHAGSNKASENKFTKQEGTGMLSGAAAGAIVGGPIGAVVGAMLGGIVGDSVGTAQRADLRAKNLEDELMETRLALSKASERTGGEQMLGDLAARLHADVMFRTNSSDLDAQVANELQSLGQLLAAHSQLEVQLHGFADPRGESAKNLELSLRRADAVREALIKGGASPEQIRLTAHGEDLTTASKDDVEAYAWERRVSMAIHPIGGKGTEAQTSTQVAQTSTSK